MGKQYLRKNHRGRLLALLIHLPTSAQAQLTLHWPHFPVFRSISCRPVFFPTGLGALVTRSHWKPFLNAYFTQAQHPQSSAGFRAVPCEWFPAVAAKLRPSSVSQVLPLLPSKALPFPRLELDNLPPHVLTKRSCWQWGLETRWICCLTSSHFLRVPSWYDFQLPS